MLAITYSCYAYMAGMRLLMRDNQRVQKLVKSTFDKRFKAWLDEAVARLCIAQVVRGRYWSMHFDRWR